MVNQSGKRTIHMKYLQKHIFYVLNINKLYATITQTTGSPKIKITTCGRDGKLKDIIYICII